MNESTICAECIHAKCIAERDRWYNWMCKASPRQKIIDFVTGEEAYLGGEKEFCYCRDINTNGKCEKFNRK